MVDCCFRLGATGGLIWDEFRSGRAELRDVDAERRSHRGCVKSNNFSLVKRSRNDPCSRPNVDCAGGNLKGTSDLLGGRQRR
jgi:hypothetical protein